MSRFSLMNLVALLACFTLYMGQFHTFANDPGLGWHLETGEYMARNGAIPHSDPFLAPLLRALGSLQPAEARSWIADQWLADFAMFAVLELGGWSLLYVFFGAVYLATFFIVAAPAITDRRRSHLAAVVATLLAFKLGQVHFILRPVVFSIFGFAVAYRMASGWATTCEAVDSRRVTRSAALAFVLFLVWANVHPGFVLGLFVFALVPLARLLDGASVRQALRLTAIPVAAVLGSLCNPYGPALTESIVSLGSSDYFMKLNAEWRPMRFDSPEGTLFLAMLSAVGGALLMWRDKMKLHWFEVLVAVPLIYGAMRGVRFLPFAAISAAPLVAAAVASISTGIRWPLLKRTLARVESMEERAFSPGTIAASFSLMAVVATVVLGHLPVYAGPLGPDQRRYPHHAIEFLEKTSEGKDAVVNHPDWGGYITYRSYPHLKAVADDRNTMLGEHFYRTVLPRLETSEGLYELTGAFGSRYVLLPRSSAGARSARNDRRFRVLYEDDVSVVLTPDVTQ